MLLTYLTVALTMYPTMSRSLDHFGNTAQKLSRSPLGIIALFVTLVYFFAALVVGPFGSHLEPGQKWMLVLFLTLFPIIILGVFVYLVVRHHTKLYAPLDFRSDESFIRTLTPEEQRSRREKEIAEEQLELNASKSTSSSTPEQDDNNLDEDPSLQMDASTRYLLAEDLVLRQIEAEREVTVRRQVALQGKSKTVTFDGIIVQSNEITAIEVKYVSSPASIGTVQDSVRRFIEVFAQVRENGPATTFKIVLAIVTNLPPKSTRRLKEHFSKTFGSESPIEVRYFNFDELRKKFGVGFE